MHSERNQDIFSKICICFVFKSYYRTRRLGVVCGSGLLENNHQICWFSGCVFHLPVKIFSWIFAFWKNLEISCENCIILLRFQRYYWTRRTRGGVRQWFSGTKNTRLTGFLAVIFTSQWKNLQEFIHSEKNLEIFWKFCTFFVLKSYYRTRRLGVVRGSALLEKIHKICWFSGCDFHLPAKKSSESYAFWKKNGVFLKILHLFCVQKLL